MTTYYISTGSNEKMYTLRKSIPTPTIQDPEKTEDNYICRLSNDPEKAVIKAKEITGITLDIPTFSLDEIKKEKTYQHMPNGKHQGKLYTEVNINYLSWWLMEFGRVKSYSKLVEDIKVFLDTKKQAIKTKNTELAKEYTEMTFGKHTGTKLTDLPDSYLSYMVFKISDDVVKMAMEMEIERRNESVEEVEEVVSEWVGEEKKRMSLVVSVKRHIEYNGKDYFTGKYVTKMMTILVDEKGNELVYFNGLATCHEKGEKFNLKFTVKEHNMRDGVKQTIIQRPNIID